MRFIDLIDTSFVVQEDEKQAAVFVQLKQSPLLGNPTADSTVASDLARP